MRSFSFILLIDLSPIKELQHQHYSCHNFANITAINTPREKNSHQKKLPQVYQHILCTNEATDLFITSFNVTIVLHSPSFICVWPQMCMFLLIPAVTCGCFSHLKSSLYLIINLVIRFTIKVLIHSHFHLPSA